MPTSKTVSTCAPETAQGTHVFRILGYSRHRGMGVGEFISSGEFSVGGHEWVVVFYPDGSKTSHEIQMLKDCILAGAQLVSKSSNVRALVELRLVADQSTGLPGLSFRVSKKGPLVFDNSHDRSRPVVTPIKRNQFEATAYCQGDCLTIECTVTVINKPLVSQTKSFPKINMPPSDITEHFGKLLEGKEGVDVTFSVGGVNFAAHKLVLATRSPVFQAELYGPMREAGTENIVIEDMQPEVFRAFLHFIYTDSLPPFDNLEAEDQSEMIRHLFVAADRYAMERLKLMCQSILCENLRVHTVASTLALADQHNCNMLKDTCIEFINYSNTLDAVAATQDYKNLKRTCPCVVIEALEKTSRFRKV
ncbi:hypothetical protein ACP70R_003112 [Stipagrostis hirtigluma subsp. patula]